MNSYSVRVEAEINKASGFLSDDVDIEFLKWLYGYIIAEEELLSWSQTRVFLFLMDCLEYKDIVIHIKTSKRNKSVDEQKIYGALRANAALAWPIVANRIREIFSDKQLTLRYRKLWREKVRN